MFRKKANRPPPSPGTFIPTPQRIIAIIQLCLVFSLMGWLGGYPFMGEHFVIKSKTALYTHVMDSPSFTSLPTRKQAIIQSAYGDLQKQASRPFLLKMSDSIRILLFDVSPFALAWMLFSLAIAILILLKIEGARQAAWILPLIVLAYGIDNIQIGTRSDASPDVALFPSEQRILADYLKEPLNSNIAMQEQQLRKGWNLYLVEEWTHETPSSDEATFAHQITQGNFAFTLARLDKLHQPQSPIPFSGMRQKEPLLLLMLYFVWNLFFAYKMNRMSNE
jgi:hypothetical protein